MNRGSSGLAGKGWASLRYAILVFWAIVCVGPLYWIATNSIKSYGDVAKGPRYLPFIDFTPNLDGWRYVLFNERERLVGPFFSSAFDAVTATVLIMLSASMATYALTRFSFFLPGRVLRKFHSEPANNLMWFLIIASRILPPVAILVPVYSIAEWHGLLDTHWLLILIYTGSNLPVAMWLLWPVFGAHASEIEEAAWLDGASHREILFGILLPSILRSVFAASFLVFLLSWNEYLFAQHLASNHAMTLPPWLVSQISAREAQIIAEEDEIVHLSAAIVLMVVPLLLLAGGVQAALKRTISGR